MKKNKLFAILFCVLTAVLVGCSGAGDSGVTPVKVTFWGSPEEIDIITSSLKTWEAEHPEIEIVFQHTPYTGYDSKILTRIAGGAAPDIITTEVDYFVTFATKGVLEDLTPYLENEPQGFSKEAFFPEIINRFTYQNKLLALPRDVAPFACVFYNKKIFDDAGMDYPEDDWTFEDLLRISRDLTQTDEDGKATRYGFYSWAWKNFVYGFGGGLVDDVNRPTKTILDSPESIEGMQFYSDMINVYKAMPAPVAFANLGMGADLLFARGLVAMFGSGVWEAPKLRTYDFEWDVAMFPRHSNGAPAFATGGTGYAMLKSSKNKAAAWEVLKALTGAEAQAWFAERGLAQPSRKAVAEGPLWAEDTATAPANKQMLNEAVKHAVYSPFDSRWREIEEKILNPKLDIIFGGKKRAEDVLKEIAPKINKELAR